MEINGMLLCEAPMRAFDVFFEANPLFDFEGKLDNDGTIDGIIKSFGDEEPYEIEEEWFDFIEATGFEFFGYTNIDTEEE